jgi:hypothetical protein
MTMLQIDNELTKYELVRNEPVHGANFTQTISREDPKVVESNIRIKEADAAHQRLKNLIVLCFALVLSTVLVGLFCWSILTGAPYSEKVIALLLTIASGLVGYLLNHNKRSGTG